MLGEDHFATSWAWAGYILDSEYFQFQPYLMNYFGEKAFFVFLHNKINCSKGVVWPTYYVIYGQPLSDFFTQ